MFLFRSAFWLIVGFILVAPHGTEFGATATMLKDQAVTAGIKAGQQIIVSQITNANRLPDLLLSVSTPSVDIPMQVSPTAPFVLPRPRPAAMA